ncbi:uncharacterized protein LOC122065155 [Macadamia integrifolia]|uniref:uncharacterized protein LOC122065155 n=1 Tax=Macadamia integrifolia TaxID=60698 RepID=UPI001C4FEE67|nr:uncharacterized protein LOC122065155 [Macadamia integrifolia]
MAPPRQSTNPRGNKIRELCLLFGLLSQSPQSALRELQELPFSVIPLAPGIKGPQGFIILNRLKKSSRISDEGMLGQSRLTPLMLRNSFNNVILVSSVSYMRLAGLWL